MVGQDPARFRRSTTATRFPCEASDQAKDLALPLPSTTTSYFSGCDTFFPFEFIPRVISCLGGDDFDQDQNLGPREPGDDTEQKNEQRLHDEAPTPPTRPAAPVTRMGCVIVQPSRLHIVSTTRKRALPLIMRS